jgi:hypothetical protein
VTPVRLDFRLLGASGWVDVAVEPNTNPEALAKPSFARDFPICTATVTYAGEGYKAAMGWVTHPFCFFGFAPVLFDAPARPSRDDLDWGAETFLCFVPMDVDRREARAILGFSWGFSIREAAISLTPPTRLAPLEWDKHHPLLGREHPAWAFATGYRNH